MFVIVGYIIVIASVLGGFALAGGHVAALWQPVEILMIAGAAAGAFVVAYGGKPAQAHGGDGALGAAADHNIGVVSLDDLERIAHRVRARRTGGGSGRVRSFGAEPNRDITGSEVDYCCRNKER